MRKVIVCGGGNGAHVFAVLAKGALGSQGVVGMYAPYQDEAETIKKAMDEQGGIEVVSDNAIIKEKIDIVSHHPSVCSAADLVVFIAPAFTHEITLKAISPYLKQNVWIGAIPARSGFEFSVPAILRATTTGNAKLFAGQTLPWACRLEAPGKRVRVIGTKDKIGVAAIPPGEAGKIANVLSKLTFTRFYPMENILAVSLSNIGQIVHPGIMYGLFKDFTGESYPEHLLFYQGVNEEIAAVLAKMSEEIQEIKKAVELEAPDISLRGVKTLKQWLLDTYQSSIRDNSSLVKAFTSNKAYDGLKAPMIKKESGYLPDFSSRYLTEDVPAGLVVTKAIAEICIIATPMIDQVLDTVSKWIDKEYLLNSQLRGKDLAETRIPQNYGISDLQTLNSALTGKIREETTGRKAGNQP
ncbi:MAG: NAD/NADP octopine/nopaline dehydrogenase family protein [Peptococcaceae bacterium]